MEFVGILVVEIVVLYLLAKNLQVGFARLFYKITGSQKATIYLLATLFLPGTFVHEIAHFLAALFLLVPVGQVELMPVIHEANKVKLGSVPIGQTDPVRRFLIGVAPLIFGSFIILFAMYLATTHNLLVRWWHFLLLGYLVFEVGNTMFLSSRDLEGAWKILVILIFALGIFYVLGLRIDPSRINLLISDKVLAVFKNACLFMGIPIGIDLSFIFLFRLLKLRQLL